MARRRKQGPWYHDFLTRLHFEAEARKVYPGLGGTKVGKGKNAAVVYVVRVTVPIYDERRTVTIRLANYREPTLIGVTVDGPTDAPHRYPTSGHLCMWHPQDGPGERWLPDEGLLRLIQYAAVHLYREAYWRETRIWAGPEAPHDDGKEEAA